MVFRLFLGVIGGLIVGVIAVGPSAAAEKPVDFDRDVRPILSDNCFACHGPDEKRRMANLRLDTEDGLFADRGSYQIVVPGDPAKSRLLARISAANRATRMPPPQAGTTLTDAQIATIRKWIEQGAKWAAPLGFRAAAAARPAGRPQREVGAQSDRPLRPGAPGTGRPEALARGRPRHAAAPPQLRPHRPAAHARRGGRLPRRQVRRRLRETGGPPARLAAVRRAHGDAVARSGPLRRYPRLPHRLAARHVEVARLGDRRLQSQHAVRPLRHRATRRRPAAQRHRASRSSPPASTATT